jgi:hypothetical protein
MMGAVTQVRVLGGTIGLTISTVVLNSHVKSALSSQLTPDQIAGIAGSLSELGKLSKENQVFVRQTFAERYDPQTRITLLFTAAVLLTFGLMVERRSRRLGGIDERGLVVIDGNMEARGIDQTEG